MKSYRPTSGGPTSGWWGTNGDESDWENYDQQPGAGVLSVSRGSVYTGSVFDIKRNWFRFSSATANSSWVPIRSCRGFQEFDESQSTQTHKPFTTTVALRANDLVSVVSSVRFQTTLHLKSTKSTHLSLTVYFVFWFALEPAEWRAFLGCASPCQSPTLPS